MTVSCRRRAASGPLEENLRLRPPMVPLAEESLEAALDLRSRRSEALVKGWMMALPAGDFPTPLPCLDRLDLLAPRLKLELVMSLSPSEATASE